MVALATRRLRHLFLISPNYSYLCQRVSLSVCVRNSEMADTVKRLFSPDLTFYLSKIRSDDLLFNRKYNDISLIGIAGLCHV